MAYPLLLKPVLKNGLYGGNRIGERFGFGSQEEISEAYLLTYGVFGENTVRNGEYAGCQLGEVLEKWGTDALGTKADFKSDFPVAVKLIEAKDRLSLKVNPKSSEIWYIIDCDASSKIIYGVNRPITRDELHHRIKTNTLSEICNFVPANKGDVFLIEAGVIHAMGKGMVALCVSENTDLSYRITDYGRLDINGRALALQTESACETALLEPATAQYGEIGEITLYPFGIVRQFDENARFCTELLKLNGKAAMLERESFISLSMLDGEAVLSYPTGNMRLIKGDGVFIPADMRITLTGTAEVITVHI